MPESSDNGTNTNTDPKDESIAKLEANNQALKNELIGARGKTQAIIEALGIEIDPNSGDLISKVSEFKKNFSDTSESSKKTLTENEQLRADLVNVQNTLGEMKAHNERIVLEKEKFALNDSLKNVLNEKGVNPSYQNLILNEITIGLKRENDGFFAVDGDSKLSAIDFASKVISKYPELIARDVKGGSGSKPPMGNVNKNYNQLIAEGRYLEADAMKKTQ